MESRSLSLGLGAGVLAATLVLGIGSMYVPASSSAPAAPADGQTPSTDWKAEADKAGMVVLAKDELDKRLQQAREEGAKQKADELAAQPASAKTVHVYIQPGMGTTDVARLLQASGVLEDGNALISLRSSSQNPIRAGVYDLPLKGDPAAVLKLIATPPKQ
ncbi:hypothetical protein [Tumebacillus flagellatus]|uniref:Aminodeoxychorismate lyase n=1 Tax=Tumebacillus flagellatus TaxID=1157490 RepID=A0A074LLG7_9BACL|nr:hypothetical protein [Tumebacillus flagellatus]KEO82961.1 hypothetical protein EL26_12760 [Tumebacillus flagellatus]